MGSVCNKDETESSKIEIKTSNKRPRELKGNLKNVQNSPKKQIENKKNESTEFKAETSNKENKKEKENRKNPFDISKISKVESDHKKISSNYGPKGTNDSEIDLPKSPNVRKVNFSTEIEKNSNIKTTVKGTKKIEELKTIGNFKEIWPDGTTYIGMMKHGRKEGEGTLKWANGSYYKGEFQNNKLNGIGSLTWKDKRNYQVNFKDNKIDGKGIFKWPDGSTYIGEYVNDKKQGKGKFLM